MRHYNIIEEYFNWVLRRNDKIIESTKLTDFIEISENSRYLERSDVVKEKNIERTERVFIADTLEFKNIEIKDHYYLPNAKLENVIRIPLELYEGKLINNETGKSMKVQIKVKTIDLLEFLYQDKSNYCGSIKLRRE